MIGAADAFSGQDPHSLSPQIRKLRFNVGWNAGKAVGRVVDQNVNLQSVYRLQFWHWSLGA
jgi:hypothetical protein